MAERRMFAKTIVLSDAFLDMPMSARCLYFTLGMFADDDGFVNNPKAIIRQCGASADDMRILIGKKFVLLFDDGIIVIKHWRINNYLRGDRHVETKYGDHKAELGIDDNGAYTFTDCDESVEVGIPASVDTGKDRLGKDSLDNNNTSRFTPPTVDEVAAYCRERANGIDAQQFVDYYTANGWKVGKNPMKDWKACVRTWERNGVNRQPAKPAQTQTSGENYDDTMRDIWLREYKKRNEGKE